MGGHNLHGSPEGAAGDAANEGGRTFGAWQGTDFPRVYEVAEEVARRYWPKDREAGSDLAHDLIVERSASKGSGRGPLSPRQLEKALTRLAERRRKRARRRSHLRESGREPAAAGLSVPPLCPRLDALAAFSIDPEQMRHLILAAASMIAGEAGVLRRSQRQAFVLGHEHRLPLFRVAAFFEAPSPKAMVERLRRASKHLETELVKRLVEVLPPSAARQLADWVAGSTTLGRTVPRQKKSANSVTPSLAQLSGMVEQGLKALVRF